MERRYVLKTPARAHAYRVDYDRELNDEQREVVLAGGGYAVKPTLASPVRTTPRGQRRRMSGRPSAVAIG